MRIVKQSLLILLAVLSTACFAASAAAQTGGGIISQTAARRYGLERSWFTQIELDRSRSRIAYITQDGDSLFVQTDAGVVHALDANTGATLWTNQIGKAEYPSLAPAASKEFVAIVNGSTLYVINRQTGQIKWTRKLGGGPGAGPAISDQHVYVPLINGRVEAFNLKKPELPPWIYSSAGRAMVQPISTGRSIAWPTDRGFLFVVQSGDQPSIRFRVETNAAITSRAVYRKPYIFVTSLDGNVYAVNEMSGDQLWRFSAGDPIAEPASVIEDRVYVPTDHAGMYCVDAATGRELWWTPRVERFLAASKERVYATDNLYQLYILDAKTGARLGTLPIFGMNMLLVNNSTDRLYLASDTGLIQCLHDASLEKPLYHNLEQASPGEATETAAGDEKPAAEAGAEGADAGVDPFAAKDADPAADEKPMAEDAADEKPMEGDAVDPFGAAPAEDAPAADEAVPAEEMKPAGEKPADEADPFAE